MSVERTKPPVRRVPCDDCTVEIDGVEYRPHAGEYVEIVGGGSIEALQFAWRRVRPTPEPPEEASDKEKEVWREQRTAEVNSYFEELCAALARRVVAWSWTDDAGQPIPQPEGNPERLKILRPEELYFLRTACASEVPAERGNGSKPSGTTSQIKARNRSKE